MFDSTPTLIIACGAIAHELTAVVRLNKLEHVTIECLPASWHNTPDRITPAVEKKISESKDMYPRILVAYGDCGTGGQLDKILNQHNIQRLPGAHCYSFFAGHDVFADMAEEEAGTFYLTDYLVDNFDRLILEDLGINKHPELRSMYFGNYTRMIYLCQSEDTVKKTARIEKAEDAASALNLPLQIHVTGLQPFERAFEQAFKSIHIGAASKHA
ncbi:MAG: DUF1638 domain-containing protein [Granulosicoccus sp.]|nr:DUF1638 domain-containing protein [Granulosicoccus sp.]